MPKVTRAMIEDLTPDNHNANKGTQRGGGLLEKSLRQYGAGRSILLDKNNRIIAGNKTAGKALEIGLDDVIVVETDGNQVVAVKRTDLDLDSEEARMLAYADNQVGAASLDFDPVVIGVDFAEGLPLDEFFNEHEFEQFGLQVDDWAAAFDKVPEGDRAPFQQMTFTLHDTQAESIREALAVAKGLGAFVDSENENSNGNALARIAELFIGDNGQG